MRRHASSTVLVQVALPCVNAPWTSRRRRRRGCHACRLNCVALRGALQTTNSNASHELQRMHKTLRSLPSLDFLRGFEAAGRRLSFTLAAEELLRHAIGAVAADQGARGRARRRAVRAPASRARADAGGRRVPSRGHRRAASRSRAAAERARGGARAPGLTVSTTVSFASLWIIPRLAALSRARIRTSRCMSPPTIALVDLAPRRRRRRGALSAGRRSARAARCACSASA